MQAKTRDLGRTKDLKFEEMRDYQTYQGEIWRTNILIGPKFLNSWDLQKISATNEVFRIYRCLIFKEIRDCQYFQVNTKEKNNN